MPRPAGAWCPCCIKHGACVESLAALTRVVYCQCVSSWQRPFSCTHVPGCCVLWSALNSRIFKARHCCKADMKLPALKPGGAQLRLLLPCAWRRVARHYCEAELRTTSLASPCGLYLVTCPAQQVGEPGVRSAADGHAAPRWRGLAQKLPV